MKTQQIGYRGKPGDNQQALVFTLMCQTCNTHRSFVFTINLMRVVQRLESGLAIESVCSVCEAKVGMSLLWANDRPGFSARNPVDSYVGEVISVSDNGHPMVWEGGPAEDYSEAMCARCGRIPKQKDSEYCPTCQTITEEEG